MKPSRVMAAVRWFECGPEDANEGGHGRGCACRCGASWLVRGRPGRRTQRDKLLRFHTHKQERKRWRLPAANRCLPSAVGRRRAGEAAGTGERAGAGAGGRSGWADGGVGVPPGGPVPGALTSYITI